MTTLRKCFACNHEFDPKVTICPNCHQGQGVLAMIGLFGKSIFQLGLAGMLIYFLYIGAKIYFNL